METMRGTYVRTPGAGAGNVRWYKVRQEVMEQLFKVNQLNISLSVLVNTFLPLYKF